MAAGLVLAAIGVTVMLAWFSHWAAVIQIRSGFVPMQFNTALCFFLLGAGILSAVISGRGRRVSIGCAFIVGFMAGLTGLQYMTGADFGIDRLIVDPYITVRALPPGRMAPNTSFCLVFLSLALLLLQAGRRDAARLGIVLMLNIVVLLLGANGFAGYFFADQSAYAWWGGGNIAPHTALALITASVGLLAFARNFYHGIESPGMARAWKPALALSAGIALTFIVDRSILIYLKNNAEKDVRYELAHTAKITQITLQNDIDALNRMQDRWNTAAINTPDAWQKDAEHYVHDNASYRSIILLDNKAGVLKAVSGSPGESVPSAADIARMTASRTNGDFITSWASGGMTYLALGFPLVNDGHPDGVILAIYDIGKKVDSVLDTDLPESYVFTLLHDAAPVYSTAAAPVPYSWKIEQDSPFTFMGPSWVLHQAADSSSYHSSGLAVFVVVAGCALSLLLAYTLWQSGKILSFAETLKVSDERYAFALHSSKIGMWDWDPVTDRVIWGGDAWEIIGVASNDVLNASNNHVRTLIQKDDYAHVMGIIERALAAQESFMVEFRLTRHDGSMIWTQSSGKAVAFRDGQATRVTGTLIDITARRHMEAQAELYRARLEAILDNMVDGLITIDEAGIVQSYSQSCWKIFGYAADEVIGRNIKMLMPSIHAEKHDQYLKNYNTTGVAKIIGIGRELEGKRKSGETFPMDLSVAEVHVGTQRFFSGIVRDITARKAAENELRRSNQELEQFAYVASHDLKTPLRNIDDLAQWVIEDAGAVLPADAREKLEMLRGRTAALETLLEDILSYSRAGRITEQSVDIDTGELIASIIQTHVPGTFKVRMEGPMEGPMPRIKSPRTPLEQIFGNLLTNAVKHHDKKQGEIIVAARREGGFYDFSVTDDGPGIPAEFHDRVFQMFQTLQSRDRVPGSGLGMAIVKKLVEWQGGRAWIEPAPGGRGASVHFLWPAGDV